MGKYCIAFLPSNDNELISLSNSFTNLNKEYKLGIESIPHVTVCQFFYEDSEIENLWGLITKNIETHQINLSFDSFSCITFDNEIFWISLLPTETEDLHNINQQITSMLKIESSRLYDPHLTLLSTKDAYYESKAEQNIGEYKKIADDFILSMGECDEIGQFTKILFQCELTSSCKNGI
ncbi:hypothetical protein ACD661_16165 [Legionella lytica]|uniref:Uncharacterized protein n=1 Tax=Legionella lytica TaxID=96232 RepID=A0ABW8DBJ5_9GAMM